MLVVVGHNLGWPWLRGGCFGVDMFFALSGFLITTLLLEDYRRHGSISLGNFFGRRCLRLYPALVLLVITSALSYFILRPEAGLERVGLVVASVLLYVSNWLVIADSQAWMGGMGHTWSLAVEVHFYVLWASTIFFVTRRWGANLKMLTTVALTVAISSATWRVFGWLGSADFNRPYAGTDTRLDALFLGAAAALYRFRYLADPGTILVARGASRIVPALEIFLVLTMGWLIYGTTTRTSLVYLGGFALGPVNTIAKAG